MGLKLNLVLRLNPNTVLIGKILNSIGLSEILFWVQHFEDSGGDCITLVLSIPSKEYADM